MKIYLEFSGLSMMSDAIGKKKFEFNLSGTTVKDVLDELIRQYGERVKDGFYDKEGNFDLMIQIALNGKSFISADKHDTSLREGDHLIFMMLLAGG